jgi:hypothetical protein
MLPLGAARKAGAGRRELGTNERIGSIDRDRVDLAVDGAEIR